MSIDNKPYTVYILKCADGTLYTGITNDVTARLIAHNEKGTGAKYTKGRRPVTLVYQEMCKDKGTALQREHAIKQYTKAEKIELIDSRNIPRTL